MTEVPTTEWSKDFDESSALGDAPFPNATWRRIPGHVDHVFTHFPLQLIVHAANVSKSTRAPDGTRWVPLDALAGRSAAERDAQSDRACARPGRAAAATRFFENAACASALTCYDAARPAGFRPRPEQTGETQMNSTRRGMMTAAGAAAAMVAVAPKAFAAWEPNERYPDPAIQTLDPAFNKYRIAQTTVEKIAGGCRWNEGPVWFGDARCLLWSDIPNNRIMRWDEETGRVSVFRKPSNFANGHTRDRQGRLISCEHVAPRHAHRI